jgi:WD40 repeat protein
MANKKALAHQANEELPPELPPGVKLLRTLKGHQDAVTSVAFDPQGLTLASGSGDGMVKLWERPV